MRNFRRLTKEAKDKNLYYAFYIGANDDIEYNRSKEAYEDAEKRVANFLKEIGIKELHVVPGSANEESEDYRVYVKGTPAAWDKEGEILGKELFDNPGSEYIQEFIFDTLETSMVPPIRESK